MAPTTGSVIIHVGGAAPNGACILIWFDCANAAYSSSPSPSQQSSASPSQQCSRQDLSQPHLWHPSPDSLQPHSVQMVYAITSSVLIGVVGSSLAMINS